MRAYFSAQLLLGWRLRTILSSNTMSIVTMVFRRVIWLLVNLDMPVFRGTGDHKGLCWRMKERVQRGRAGASPAPTIHGWVGLPGRLEQRGRAGASPAPTIHGWVGLPGRLEQRGRAGASPAPTIHGWVGLPG